MILIRIRFKYVFAPHWRKNLNNANVALNFFYVFKGMIKSLIRETYFTKSIIEHI